MAFAFYFSQWERHTISPSVLPSLHDVLKSLSYASTTIIFAISGILASYYMFVANSISWHRRRLLHLPSTSFSTSLAQLPPSSSSQSFGCVASS